MSTCMTSGMMSSLSDDWETPVDLFDRLDEEFDFDLDVCATDSNHKCARYYTEADNGLEQPWEGTVWMNPPYGRAIGDWMRKAMLHGSGGDRRVPRPRPDGYAMVEGVLHECE